MNRWQRARARQGEPPADDLPVVLAAEGPHGPVVQDTNRRARLAGVAEGARVTDMRALCPDLRVFDADPGQDGRALERLMIWARRWCPWTATDGARGLVLDTTGADHLWGGEAAMLAEIEGTLAALGFEARVAVAPTWGAAWALARYGPVRAISAGPEPVPDLAGLPAAALRLDADTVLDLQRLGLKTVGALAAVPRAALARRFGRAGPGGNPLLRLDQALGRLPEPLSLPGEPPDFRVTARLAEPIFDPTHFLPGLCEALCARLAEAGRGCRRLRLSVFRTDGEVRSLGATLALASRDPVHFARLVRDRLERIDPGFGFDLILLEALRTEALAPAQAGLDGRDGTAGRVPLGQLIDRLAARFGASALSCPEQRQSHVPERAVAQAPASASAEPGPAAGQGRPDRPLRLFERPEALRVLYALPEGPPMQFVWRHRLHRVLRHAGPERIAPEWWHDRPGTRLRDYFRVEVATGQRFWIYREGLHGDRRGGDPVWFLHGIFA